MLTHYRDLNLDLDEKWLLEVARDVLRESANEVIHVVDVGAATGRWSMYVNEILFELETRFHLFEPTFEQFQFLHETFGERPDFFLMHAAVYNSTRLAQFQVRSCLEHSSLTEVGGSAAVAKLETIICVNLVDYVKFAGLDRIHLLKIDTEGAEPEILRGLSPMLDAGLIDIIQFEYGGAWNESPVGVVDDLRAAGYGLLSFDEENKEVVIYEPVDDGKMKNILAVRSI